MEIACWLSIIPWISHLMALMLNLFSQKKMRILPFDAEWAKKKGIDHPGYIKLMTVY